MIVEKTYTKKAKIVLLDEVNCFIAGLHPDHVEYFYNEYAVKAENYFFAPAYKLKKWDGKIRFFDKAGKTYQYLLEEIIPKIVAFGYEMELDDRRVHKGVTVESVDSNYFSEFIDPKTNNPYELRWYQTDAINAVLETGHGIIIAGTGAGKTAMNVCIADVYAKQGLRTLTIVPNLSLIDRTVSEFKFFNLDVGEISGTVKDYKKTHVVSTWQSLKNMPHVLKEFQVVIIDECHGVKGNVLRDLLTNHGAHIPYRIGLTGTLPKAPADRLAVKVAIGETVFTISAQDLIEQGFLATLNVHVMQLNDQAIVDDYDLEEKIMTYELEKQFLEINEDRISWITEFLVEKSQQHKGNVLCLVTSVPFAKKLHKLIPESKLIYGKTERDVRQEIFNLFENNNNLIVIATIQIAGVGINIDRIFNLVLVDLGKSFVRTIQGIGRGLRKSGDKTHVDVLDICSNLKYSKQHLNKRVKYYKEANYPHKKYTVKYAFKHNDAIGQEGEFFGGFKR